MTVDTLGSLALIFSSGGALVTFGVMYGALKKEQDSLKEELKEFKAVIRQDIGDLRDDIKEFATAKFNNSIKRDRGSS